MNCKDQMIGWRDCPKLSKHAIFVKTLFLAASKGSCLYWGALHWAVQLNLSVENHRVSSLLHSVCWTSGRNEETPQAARHIYFFLNLFLFMHLFIYFTALFYCSTNTDRVHFLLPVSQPNWLALSTVHSFSFNWFLWVWASFKHFHSLDARQDTQPK